MPLFENENFCGDRLRLSAFLRVVEAQPSRMTLGKNIRSTHDASLIKANVHFRTLVTCQSEKSRPVNVTASAYPEHVLSSADVEPDQPNHVLYQQTSISPSSASLPEENEKYENVSSTPVPKETNYLDSLIMADDHDFNHTRSKKSFKVYKSKAGRANHYRSQLAITRETRLAVDELILVRTTTIAGLPFGSVWLLLRYRGIVSTNV